MTLIAPLIEAILDETLARQRGVSRHTRNSYALSFQLLFMFAAKRLKVSPSALTLEQLDAGLISAFLEYLECKRKNAPVTRNVRRAAEEGGEPAHMARVILLNLLLVTARRHVFDHALAHRAGGFVEHRESSCLAWGYDPTILRHAAHFAMRCFPTDYPRRSPTLPRERFSPWPCS